MAGFDQGLRLPGCKILQHIPPVVMILSGTVSTGMARQSALRAVLTENFLVTAR